MRTYFADGGVSIEEDGVPQELKVPRWQARWAAGELKKLVHRSTPRPVRRWWKLSPQCVIEVEVPSQDNWVILTVNDWERYYPRPEEFRQFMEVLKLYGDGKDCHGDRASNFR